MKPYSKFRKSQTKRKNHKTRSNIDITGFNKDELEQILEKRKRKEKFERKHNKLPKTKIQKTIIQSPPQQKTISLDQNLILAFIQFLLQKNLITKEELQNLTLSENNPLKGLDIEVKKEEVLDKIALRDLWIQMMHQNKLFCELCGNPITEAAKGPWRLTAEHRIPRSRGGKTDSTNLDPAHSICNCLKADMFPEEWARIGLDRLRSSGIPVDLNHVGYRYLREHMR